MRQILFDRHRPHGMRATFFVVLFLFFSVLFSTVATPVLAQASPTDFGLEAVDEQIALSGDSIVVIILRVIRIVLGFLGLVLVIMIIYAGYTIMTAAGIEERVARGKLILRNAIIGTAIILFAFAIVQFVINILSDASGATSPTGGGSPRIETFLGVGSLGTVIKDHYPEPNQTDVFRNTKIVVTFTDDIDPSSIIENTNNSCWNDDQTGFTTTCDADALPYYGDCIAGNCDTLNTDVIRIVALSDRQGTEQGEPLGADVQVAYDGNGQAHTFVFKPRTLLGTDQGPVWHRVRITNAVQDTAGDGIFAGRAEDQYQWEFETNTEIDITPPYVTAVSPKSGELVEKNRILKITFNEPVDPMMVQGRLAADSSFRTLIVDMVGTAVATPDESLTGDGATLTGGEAITVEGEWKITNGYRTVEFVSYEACGINSCGEEIYCLPTQCAAYDKTCTVGYAVLARTASVADTSEDAFVSAGLFDGVVDLADNAMDSAPTLDSAGSVIPGAHDFLLHSGDGWVHKPPLVGNGRTIAAAELASDNYWWFFTVKNVIDSTAPYVSHVDPGIDQQGVGAYVPVQVYFSKEMWTETLSQIRLMEYPDSGVGIGYRHQTQDDVIGDTTRSVLRLLHPARPFGAGGTDRHYFASVPGTVKSVNQFCLYPGRGPVAEAPQTGISTPACEVSYDESGNIVDVSHCVPGMDDVTSDTDTGCVTTIPGLSQTAESIESCLDRLSTDAVSPSVFVPQPN